MDGQHDDVGSDRRADQASAFASPVVKANVAKGTVSIQLKGPDGLPLRTKPVQVFERTDPWKNPETVYNGNTDANGWIVFNANSDVQAFQIIAPRIGYGATGSFLLHSGEHVTEQVPPLGKFASVGGIVAFDAIKPGMEIVGSSEAFPWYLQRSPVGVDGSFHIHDVLAGELSIGIVEGQSESGLSPTLKDIAAGQNISIILDPPDFQEIVPAVWRDRLYHIAPTLDGEVTDTKGNPIEGATVYRFLTLRDGINAPELVVHVVTGVDGRFSFGYAPLDQRTGLAHGTLAVSTPNMAPVTKVYRLDESQQTPEDYNSKPAICVSIAVGDTGGNLDVKVLKDGSPDVGDLVQIRPEDGVDLTVPELIKGIDPTDAAAIWRLLSPISVTDKRGIAHFTHVAPGKWRVHAGGVADAKDTQGPYGDLSGRNLDETADADKVVVRNNQASQVTLVELPQGTPLAMRVSDSNGPIQGDKGIFIEREDTSGDELKADGAGTYNGTVYGRGLHAYKIIARDVPHGDLDGHPEPYSTALQVVALSPVLQDEPPVDICASSRLPGSIKVKLVDWRGRPVRGAVDVWPNGEGFAYALSTNAEGMGEFPAMPTRSYDLDACPYDEPSGNMVIDPPYHTISVVSGKVSSVVFRILPPGSISAFDKAGDKEQERISRLEKALITWSMSISGTVRLSDGTPANRATVAMYLSHYDNVRPLVTTDASGKVEYGPIKYWNPWDETGDKNRSKPYVYLVALVPEECGAVIVPLKPGEPVDLTLPKPVDQTGRITVGGSLPGDSGSTYEVYARYRRAGNLGDLLSVEARPQEDGKFELDGLTCGVYFVQACRDGIWFSPTKRIEIKAGKTLPPITLDIPNPGGPMEFHCADESGFSLRNAAIAFDPPVGPLVDKEWPQSFLTDGVGNLRFDGLSAGHHVLRVGSLSYGFDVPPFHIGQGLHHVDITCGPFPGVRTY